MTHSREKIKGYVTSYLFIIPGLLLFFIFNVYPFIQSYLMSIRDWSGFGLLSDAKFIGIGNYIEVFNDKVFWESVLRVAKVTIAVIIIEIPLSVLLAVLVANSTYSMVHRVVYFIPTILSAIIIGMMWKWIYDANFGIINQLLDMIGLDSLKYEWLGRSETAMGAVTVTFIWHSFGTFFLLIYAGLTGIDNQLYEAAIIEGSSTQQTFFYITLPLLIPTIILASILLILNAMQIFGEIVMMTNGGPGYATEVPSLRIYKEAFDSQKMGYATAMSVVFGLILAVFSMLQLYASRKLRTRYDV